MDKYFATPLNDPKSGLALGFADFIRRLSIRLGALPEEAEAAGHAALCVIEALAEGDVCADLRRLAQSLGRPPEDVRALLHGSQVAVCGGEGRKLPLVCDDAGRIYLYRYFDYEKQLADAIVERVPTLPYSPLPQDVRAFLDAYFAGNRHRLDGRPDRQRMAVEMAYSYPLTIISGGPGTGKTTIVTALIAALSMRDVPLHIALAAPTGKAAARMEEALLKQARLLDPALQNRLPVQASTLHRLLGVRPQNGTFRYCRENPLPCDLLVVDEASMLDLALAARLFSALPPGARVVLLGDKDQLAAVEAGAVFADLAGRSCVSDDEETSGKNESAAETGGVSDCVVWLDENYRFSADSPIGQLAHLVVTGRERELASWLSGQPRGDVHWLDAGDGLPKAFVEGILSGYESFFEAVKKGHPGEVLDAYGEFCVLCALRRGKRGVDGINDMVARRLGLAAGPVKDSPWFDGRPVMITENDYQLDLFNGDIGIALLGPDGHPDVWFRAKDLSVRSVSAWSLPEHQTAFAMTVHKAQGSEFQNVAFVLPERDSPVLTRELIYTAVTRAKKKLSIYGSMDVLQGAVCRSSVRRGNLAGRISAHRGKTAATQQVK